MKFIFRWIPSELNIADFDSRNFESIRSLSDQVRQTQRPYELHTNTSSEATLSVAIRNRSVKNKSDIRVRCSAVGHLSHKSDISSENNCVPTKSSFSSAWNDVLQSAGKSQNGGTSNSEGEEVSERDVQSPKLEKFETGRLGDGNRGQGARGVRGQPKRNQATTRATQTSSQLPLVTLVNVVW